MMLEECLSRLTVVNSHHGIVPVDNRTHDIV